MKNISQQEWIEWKKKRRHTLIGFVIVGTIVGIDYSFMFTTLYRYLKDMIKTDKPGVFYGLIIGIYCMASTMFGLILARWVDRYRKVKLFTIIVLILQIIGIILYVIPTSVVYAMVGRFICGIGDPYTSVCSGEVVRIYNQEEGTSAIWWLAACYSLGFMIGPVFVFFFKNVDFYIAGIHFNQLNSVGILVAGFLIIALIAVYFLIHDCSAIIDLKMYLKENGRLNTGIDDITTEIPVEKSTFKSKVSEAKFTLNPSCTQVEKNCSSDGFTLIPEKRCPTNSERILLLNKDENDLSVKNNSANYSVNDGGSAQMTRSWETESMSSILCALLTNVDALLMYISTSVFVYSLFALDVILPLLSDVVLHWSLTALTVILVANGIVYFALILISSKYCVTDRTVYYLLIISITSVILTFVIIILIKQFNGDLTASVVMMAIFVVLWALGWVVEEVLIRCTLAKMVPSTCQSFTEAIRNSVSRLSMILAAITVPLSLPYLNQWCTGLIIINAVLLVAFLMRRRSLLLVREVEFRSNYVISKKTGASIIPSGTSANE